MFRFIRGPVARFGRMFLAGYLAACILTPGALAAESAARPLTLADAINRALEYSPVLSASVARVEAAQASRSQAGALPNPELSVEAGNIYGDGPYDGMDSAEITYGVSQLVELPGKRGSRAAIAGAESDKAHHNLDATRLDLIRDVTIAFVELAAAERDLEIARQEQTLVSEVSDSVAARVEAGKEPPIRRNKADIELSSGNLALDRAKRTLSARKQTLRILMGNQSGDIAIDPRSLPALNEPEPLDAYLMRLNATPDLLKLDSDVAQAQSGLSLERANAVPDPTLGIGVRQFREDDSQALVAGLSLPLPVFNLNRAGIAKAEHNLHAAKLEQRGGLLSLETQLTELHDAYISAWREITALNESVLPGAEESFAFARAGYEAGKFGYLEVLDAQRTLFQARRQASQAVLDYHRIRAAIERMTAIHAAHSHKDRHD